MKVSICGLGNIGFPLGKLLRDKGHEVSGTKRKAISLAGIHVEELLPLMTPSPSILSCDLLILNIPPFPGQESWFSSWDLSMTKKIIFVSSTSVLRASPHQSILEAEESWVKNSGIPWLIVRPAGLISEDRHPGKSLSGKKEIKGRLHPVNLIHHDDVIGFLLTAIENGITGEEINLVSDEHRSKEEYYSEYCKRHGLPLPEFDQTDMSSGKIISNELMKKYYKFR
jgi:nucleoside-diphosphate-sugar epimerase